MPRKRARARAVSHLVVAYSRRYRLPTINSRHLTLLHVDTTQFRPPVVCGCGKNVYGKITTILTAVITMLPAEYLHKFRASACEELV